MQKATYCILSGFIIYIISLFLPAYMDFTGYETLAIALIFPFEESIYDLPVAIHFFFLGIHNFLLMGALCTAHFFVEKIYPWLLWILLMSVINVIGFFFISLSEHAINELQIGYYLWTLASLLIVGGIFWKQLIFWASESE